MSASFKDFRNTSLAEVEKSKTPALGFLEVSSISRGLFLTDAILKKAPVKVIASQPISTGKHAILFFGDVAEVQESYQEACTLAESSLLKNILISGVHEGLIPFLDSIWAGVDSKTNPFAPNESIGIVESTNLASAILAADSALKSARVELSRFRLGQGIGGKAYFVVSGPQEETEASLEAAKKTLDQQASLVRVDLIARPSEEALIHF